MYVYTYFFWLSSVAAFGITKYSDPKGCLKTLIPQNFNLDQTELFDYLLLSEMTQSSRSILPLNRRREFHQSRCL